MPHRPHERGITGVPAENWDYTATHEMALAEMEVDGVTRKVLLQAPKNGFFYVPHRAAGALLRAHPFATVNWASTWTWKLAGRF